MEDAQLQEGFVAVMEIVRVLESDDRFTNLAPYGEPQLGPRGLYPTTGGTAASEAVMAMLWMMAYSDGGTSVLQIAERSGVHFRDLLAAAATLEDAGLLGADRSGAVAPDVEGAGT